MNDHTPENREAIRDLDDTQTADAPAESSGTAAEIEQLRRRLAALEASASSSAANRLSQRQVNSRIMTIGLVMATLAAAWILSGTSSVVHSQGTDPLTIDTNGNVGIRTTKPGATLDVNGDFRAASGAINGDLSFRTLRFPDGTTQVTAAPPAGAVIAFDLQSCPAGWTEYSQAYGRFIRGIDKSGARIDSDGQRSPGGTQEDAIRNITGSISGVQGASNRAWDWGFRPGQSGAFNVPFNLSKYNPYGGGEYSPNGGVGYSASFDASRVVPTAAENRPRNVALLYCRKN